MAMNNLFSCYYAIGIVSWAQQINFERTVLLTAQLARRQTEFRLPHVPKNVHNSPEMLKQP